MAFDRDRFLKSFGRNLAAFRQRAGMTQEELAEETGLHRTYIGGLERGARNPTATTLLKLKRALECSLDDLLGR